MTAPEELAATIKRRATDLAWGVESGIASFPPDMRAILLAAVARRLLARAAELETEKQA